VRDSSPGDALLRAAEELDRRGQAFALVGGLGVSVRGEVRFTRDVDLAIAVASDAETEALVLSLGASGYTVVAVVEQEAVKRLATVRLKSPSTVVVDLIAASSGIEAEVVARAEAVSLDEGATVRVARAEELLALKVLSMTSARPQDRMDAQSLLEVNPNLDLGVVRELLGLITARGFHRAQDLGAKLDRLLARRDES
jgi:Nucleotidyl transferase AbiEii toxin, Type IV TA system